MGDGEIVVCGAETPGELRFKAEVVDLKDLPTPFIETEDLVSTVYSADSIDAAANGAIHRMAQFLTGIAGIPLNDAGMLMSLVGELKFCQVVDPLKTVRFEFPKNVLEAYGYRPCPVLYKFCAKVYPPGVDFRNNFYYNGATGKPFPYLCQRRIGWLRIRIR
jgi:amidase